MFTHLKLILATLLIGVFAWARVDVTHTKRLYLPQSVSNQDKVAEASKEIVPTSLSANDSSRTVVSKIIDNSLAYWWNNSDFKNTAVGQAADTIEHKMKTEMSLGESAGEDKKIDHRLSLKLLASQALAKLEYKGWLNAAINYDARASKTEAEVLENLANNKDLVISHSVTSEENKSQLSLRWNW